MFLHNNIKMSFENIIYDAVLIINNQLTLLQETDNDADDKKREFSNITTLIMSELFDNVELNNIEYIAEVVLCVEKLSFQDYLAKGCKNGEVTREDFLGLAHHFLETQADKIRAKNLLEDYNKNSEKYEGKPISSILKNDLYRYVCEFIE